MRLEDLVQTAVDLPPKRISVAQAADEDVLKAVLLAQQKGIAEFILIGKQDEIIPLLQSLGGQPETFLIIEASSSNQACQIAVQLVAEGEADIVMKGQVATAELLRAVLNKEKGLRTSQLISHVAVFEVQGFERLLFVTDAAMNIAPTLTEKAGIVENAVQVAHALGVVTPKVAPICAVEVVNPNMQATLDAAALSLMNQRGQLTGCVIDGPLALDNAISFEAAEHKKISSAVAGQADILLVPTIEAGNALYKSLVYFARAKVGALIVGAKAPIILTSRADSDEAKLYSIALASLHAAKLQS